MPDVIRGAERPPHGEGGRGRAEGARGRGRTAIGIAAVVLAGALAAAFLLPREKSCQVNTFAMGSYVEQTVYGSDPQTAAARASAAVTELENLISWRVEGSDIDRLNHSGPDGAEIDSRTWDILQVCRAVSRDSGGAFNPTIAPVSRLWDFDGEPHVPSQAELTAALEQVDCHALSLPIEYDAVLALGHSLDLGAVGKGAACDAVLQSWKESGVSRGVASVGGSVGLYGRKPWGQPWNVAVRDPAGKGSLGTLALKGGCVSTSGSYEKTFTENGKTYHHLLDPFTGYPADSGLVSVTVWRDKGDGKDGAFSDALATACFVLGLEKSRPLLERFEAGAVFVTAEGGVSVTKDLEGSFSLTASGYAWEDLP